MYQFFTLHYNVVIPTTNKQSKACSGEDGKITGSAHTHLYSYRAPSVPQETWMNFDHEEWRFRKPLCTWAQDDVWYSNGRKQTVSQLFWWIEANSHIHDYWQSHTNTPVHYYKNILNTHSHEYTCRADWGLIIAWYNQRDSSDWLTDSCRSQKMIIWMCYFFLQTMQANRNQCNLEVL